MDTDNENINNPNSDVSWLDKPCIPLLSRVSFLPIQIGTSDTDVAHGEAHAMARRNAHYHLAYQE